MKLMVYNTFTVKQNQINETIVDVLNLGGYLLGGYPLHLLDDSTFSDYVIYTDDWNACMRVFLYLKNKCDEMFSRLNVIEFRIGGISYQLNKPYGNNNFISYMNNVDMSASGVILIKDENDKYILITPFYEDIRNKVCTVLQNHEWTWYRINTYTEKGYLIND